MGCIRGVICQVTHLQIRGRGLCFVHCSTGGPAVHTLNPSTCKRLDQRQVFDSKNPNAIHLKLLHEPMVLQLPVK